MKFKKREKNIHDFDDEEEFSPDEISSESSGQEFFEELGESESDSPDDDKYEEDHTEKHSIFSSDSENEGTTPSNYYLQSNIELPTEYSHLENMDFLTEEETLLLTQQRCKQLINLYKLQFQRLYDLLVYKHTQFRKKHAEFLKSLENVDLERDKEKEKEVQKQKALFAKEKRKLMWSFQHIKDAKRETRKYYYNRNKRNLEKNRELKNEMRTTKLEDAKKCSIENCFMSVMIPSTFCYAHILNDPDQKLFTGCKYKTSRGICNYPIIIMRNPPICAGHIDLISSQPKKDLKQQLQLQLQQQKSNDDIINSSNCASFPPQRIYDRIFELVNEIQVKRKQLLKRNRDKDRVMRRKLQNAVNNNNSTTDENITPTNNDNEEENDNSNTDVNMDSNININSNESEIEGNGIHSHSLVSDEKL